MEWYGNEEILKFSPQVVLWPEQVLIFINWHVCVFLTKLSKKDRKGNMRQVIVWLQRQRRLHAQFLSWRLHFKICVCIPKLHEAGDEFTAKSCKDIRTFAQQLNVKENSTYWLSMLCRQFSSLLNTINTPIYFILFFIQNLRGNLKFSSEKCAKPCFKVHFLDRLFFDSCCRHLWFYKLQTTFVMHTCYFHFQAEVQSLVSV